MKFQERISSTFYSVSALYVCRFPRLDNTISHKTGLIFPFAVLGEKYHFYVFVDS